MFKKKKRRAQTTAEYAILIGVVVLAIIGMQTYLKRGLQARYKDAGDDYVNNLASAGDWGDISNQSRTITKELQYEHGAYHSRTTQNVIRDNEDYIMQAGGATARDVTRETIQATEDYRQYNYTQINTTN